MRSGVVAGVVCTGLCVTATVGVVRGQAAPPPVDERPTVAVGVVGGVHRSGGVTRQPPAAPAAQVSSPTAQPTAIVPARPLDRTEVGDPLQPAVPPAQRLPADDAAQLTRLAGRLVAAEMSGIGRAAFDGAESPPARGCCHRVRVHAATAGRHSNRAGVAVVLVTWSAGPAGTGEPTGRTVTPLSFVRAGDGGWRPLPAGAVR